MPTLITIGPSPYVEKARWALEHHGISFVEQAHVPLFHWRATRPHHQQTVPLLLLDGGGRVGESSEIVAWADAQRPGGRPLLPDRLREQVAWLDDKVGRHGRRVAYQAMFQAPRLARSLFDGSPRWERAALNLVYPLWKGAIVRGLGVTDKRAAASRDRLREVFDEVSGWLADGRPWLDGEHFSALDLTLASMSGSILLMAEHGWPHPSAADVQAHLEERAAPLLDLRRDLLATPAGALVTRAYRSARRPI